MSVGWGACHGKPAQDATKAPAGYQQPPGHISWATDQDLADEPADKPRPPLTPSQWATKGRLEERRAVVEWLRADLRHGRPWKREQLADRIERGEHRYWERQDQR